MLTFRYSNRQQSVPVRIMLVPKSELKKKAKNLKHVLYINVQKARSVHRFAAQLNLTNNPDRSSLVQFYLGPFNESCGWIYEYFCFYFSQEPRNRTDPRQTQNKRLMKKRYRLLLQVLLQQYTSGVIACELVVLPSWHCFRNPDALDLRLCLVRNVRQ